MSGVTGVRVDIEGGAVIRWDEVWPDGDGPDNPTAEDVRAVIKDIGIFTFLNDWEFSDTLVVYVDGERVLG